jgi:palmitoyltransferase
MTLLCHTFCIYTNPGTLDYTRVEKLKDNQKEFCKKCNKYRPLRAHHCSTCDKCIMKMDHHCPWIFNCVGYGNQKIFFLFLFYASLGCFIAFVCLVTIFFTDHFSYILRHPKYKIDFNTNFFLLFIQIVFSLSDAFAIIMGTVLALAMSVSIGGLFFTQLNFISRNMTGVEDTIYDDDPEMNIWYAKKDRWFMIKTVLGLGSRWKWFLPIVEENKYNSGYLFDTPYERIAKKKKEKKENEEDSDDENKDKNKDDKNNKKEKSKRCGC